MVTTKQSAEENSHSSPENAKDSVIPDSPAAADSSNRLPDLIEERIAGNGSTSSVESTSGPADDEQLVIPDSQAAEGSANSLPDLIDSDSEDDDFGDIDDAQMHMWFAWYYMYMNALEDTEELFS